MSEYLVATASVHVSAAAADFLADRASADDTVWVLAVREDGADPRDAEDALNVAEVRLGALATVETAIREGDPGEEIVAAARERDVDLVVIGPWSGSPDADAGLGDTASRVVENADRPVVVVPLPEP